MLGGPLLWYNILGETMWARTDGGNALRSSGGTLIGTIILWALFLIESNFRLTLCGTVSVRGTAW